MAGANWIAACLAGVCVLLAGWSFALLYEGFIADRYSGIFTYPFVDEAAAEHAYARLPQTAPIAAREVAARRLVEADPANPESWNALSYAEFLKAGRMSPVAIEALDRSYTLSFFDRQEAVWRVGYALENWPALPPSLRAAVVAEVRAALSDPALAPGLKRRLEGIHDPAGRLAATMMVTQP